MVGAKGFVPAVNLPLPALVIAPVHCGGTLLLIDDASHDSPFSTAS